MINFKNYVKVGSLEEAWLLNQKKSNRIIGGMLWLRLENLKCDTAIDISGLGLDKIEETEGEFRIGAMVSLHDLETNGPFLSYTSGVSAAAFHHIVGVQFRNMATIGGTVYGRYGFSDVLTLLLALDTTVVLYKGGEVKLQDYMWAKADNDIITHIVVKKTPCCLSYQSVRAQKTDFPTLTCAVNYTDGKARCVIGARPGKARSLVVDIADFSEETLKETGRKVAAEISTGSNIKGSAEYRTRLIKGLVKRALEEIGGRA